jgi:hypothetical protein
MATFASAGMVRPERAPTEAGCEFSEISYIESSIGVFAKLAGFATARRCRGKAITVDNREEEEMEAYRIDRFGSVDGIVLRSSEDPRPGPKEILMRVRASSQSARASTW